MTEPQRFRLCGTKAHDFEDKKAINSVIYLLVFRFLVYQFLIFKIYGIVLKILSTTLNGGGDRSCRYFEC